MRHALFMLNDPLKELYASLLSSCDAHHVEQQGIVLNNLICYFHAEERRMVDAEQSGERGAAVDVVDATVVCDSIKEMCDVQSGMGSTVAQVCL